MKDAERRIVATALRMAAAESESAARIAASSGTQNGRDNAERMAALSAQQRVMAELIDHAFARVTVQVVLPAGSRRRGR